MEIINTPIDNPVDELEQLILSIMLNDTSTIPQVVARLNINDFTDKTNRSLYAAIVSYYTQHNRCDPALLITYIETTEQYMINKPAVLIMKIMNLYTDSYNLTNYIDIVKMNATIRHLKKFGNDIQDKVIDFSRYNDEVWDIQKKFMDIVNTQTSSSMLEIETVTSQFTSKLEQVKLKKGLMNGTTSGFKEIDAFTNGFQQDDLIILAARPSIGKTALALNMLLNAAKECKQNECVVIFSLEMGSQQLIERLVSAETSINSQSFKSGTLSQDEDLIITECVSRINKLPIYIDESSNISILEIQTKLKQISSLKKIKLVIVDYLQLVSGSSKNIGVNRQQEVSQISRTLKSIARDIKSPLIAVAQLSRKIEERKGADKKPILSDLRESGSIEQDADMVVFLNYDRDEVDNNSSNNSVKQYSNVVVVDFIIAKHRNGATGEAKLLFEKQYGKYSDYKG